MNQIGFVSFSVQTLKYCWLILRFDCTFWSSRWFFSMLMYIVGVLCTIFELCLYRKNDSLRNRYLCLLRSPILLLAVLIYYSEWEKLTRERNCAFCHHIVCFAIEYSPKMRLSVCCEHIGKPKITTTTKVNRVILPCRAVGGEC